MTISNETKLAVNTAILAGIQEEAQNSLDKRMISCIKVMVHTNTVIKLAEEATDEMLNDSDVVSAILDTLVNLSDTYTVIYPVLAAESILDNDGLAAKIATAIEKMSYEIRKIALSFL